LYVVDTGAGRRPALAGSRDGLGLSNVEERLQRYYGAAGVMSIRETVGGGTTVEVCIPWNTTDAEALSSAV